MTTALMNKMDITTMAKMWSKTGFMFSPPLDYLE